ncbi:MAG TPA: ABC transporter ATP-binding protein [Caldilineaceae bacterium]|nr:ABC transporter ATP-binding protein [Caldilineaceae bacterium]
MRPVLEVLDLTTYYHTARGPVKAVDGVSFRLYPGQRFGLIGESGSGKSTIALSLLRLIRPPGRIERGSVLLDGVDLLSLSDEEMRQKRLAEIALISQGAMNSLNPVIRVRTQMEDGFRSHGVELSEAERDRRIAELLAHVGLPPSVADLYPHQLSGGMKQRVCIAIAISLRPKVIIADEPTSALDVVVQRRVMQTLRRVQEEIGSAVILIGHDMGLMAQFADQVGVMYAGKLVEEGPVRQVFAQPQHPYTQLLMESLPSLESREMSRGVSGAPPSLLSPPPGCVFHPRCPYVMDRCKVEAPLLQQVTPGHRAACHLLDEQPLPADGVAERSVA